MHACLFLHVPITRYLFEAGTPFSPLCPFSVVPTRPAHPSVALCFRVLTCSFGSVIPLCFFHYRRDRGRSRVCARNGEKSRAQKKGANRKNETKKEKMIAVAPGRRATRTIRHPRFNLTSHLCHCETTEAATVEPHQSGLLQPVAISLTYFDCPFPFCLAASRGCKCHWRHSVARRSFVRPRLNCFTILAAYSESTTNHRYLHFLFSSFALSSQIPCFSFPFLIFILLCDSRVVSSRGGCKSFASYSTRA